MTITSALTLPDFPLQKFLLPNGLTLIVEEDHRAAVATLQVWCKTGSAHEGRFLGGGVSHILEHMLFKGTKSFTAGEISRSVAELGGDLNAMTSFDYTMYMIDLPTSGNLGKEGKKSVEVGVEILADMVLHATLPEEEFVKEQEVIRRELAMYADRPESFLLEELLLPTVFPNSPYGEPIGGRLDIYNTITRDDVFAYYRERYVPQNMAFVVVGDVIGQEVFAQLGQLFAEVPRRTLNQPVMVKEPIQLTKRVMRKQYPTELSRLCMAWRVPGSNHPDAPVLDILASVLGDGRSSLLHQELREKAQLVEGISVSYETFGTEEGLFLISAITDSTKRAKSEEAIAIELTRFLEHGVTQKEIIKAQKGILASHYRQLTKAKRRASDYGDSWVATGDPQFGRSYLEALQKITPEQVQRVAIETFQDARLSVLSLDPQEKPSETSKEEFQPLKKEILGRKTSKKEKKKEGYNIQKFLLSHGLPLLVCEDHSLPHVNLHAMFRGGLLAENASNNGITQLLAATITKGTQRSTAVEIANRIEAVGGSLGAAAHSNSITLSEHLLAEDLDLGIELLAELLLEATFPEEEGAREKMAQLAAIKAQEDHVLMLAGKAFKKQLFGEHPYARPLLGVPETVVQLNSKELLNYYQRYFVGANGIIAVSGKVKAEAVVEKIEAALMKMPTGSRSLEKAPHPSRLEKSHQVVLNEEKEQAVIIQGFLGAAFQSPDRVALELLEEATSDMGSRFFERIREQHGLAYYVGGSNSMGFVPGSFSFYLGCDPKKVSFAGSELQDEIRKLAEEGLSQGEFERCKQQLLGAMAFAQESSSGMLLAAMGDELLGLGYDHYLKRQEEVEQITLKEVQRVAHKYFGQQERVEVILSPKAIL